MGRDRLPGGHLGAVSDDEVLDDEVSRGHLTGEVEFGLAALGIQ